MTHCLRVRKGVADDLDGLSACKEELSVLGSHTPVHLNHQTPVTTFCLEMQFSPNCGISPSTLQHWRPLCPFGNPGFLFAGPKARKEKMCGTPQANPPHNKIIETGNRKAPGEGTPRFSAKL